MAFEWEESNHCSPPPAAATWRNNSSAYVLDTRGEGNQTVFYLY